MVEFTIPRRTDDVYQDVYDVLAPYGIMTSSKKTIVLDGFDPIKITPYRRFPNFIRSQLTRWNCSETRVHLDDKIVDSLPSPTKEDLMKILWKY